MKHLLILCLAFGFISCEGTAQKTKITKSSEFKINKTEAEWKNELSPMQYNVLRKSATERAFSSPLDKNFEAGTYYCAGCNTPLFESEHKFDSGTGWPSFDQPIEGHVAYSKTEGNAFYGQEEHCATCGGHLGHVFTDGPKSTTGKRHCINGVALTFVPKS